MAKRIQLIRHNTVQANAFQGLQGEPTIDLTALELRVHDGLTPGGIKIARADLANVAVATSSVPGKMSALQVVELADVIAGLAIEIAARIADVDSEEARALGVEATLATIASLNAHIATYNAFVAQKAAANGLASLDASSQVVQNALTATSAAACTGNSATVTNGVYLTGAQVLAEKTLTSPVLNGTLSGTALKFRGATVYNNTDQSIPDVTTTILTFNSERYDTDAIHSVSVNTSRLTVPAGVTLVRITATVTFTGSVGGNSRTLSLLKNGGGTNDSNRQGTLSGSQVIVKITPPPFIVIAGDYFEITVYQNSGAALDVQCSTTHTTFEMELLHPL